MFDLHATDNAFSKSKLLEKTVPFIPLEIDSFRTYFLPGTCSFTDLKLSAFLPTRNVSGMYCLTKSSDGFFMKDNKIASSWVFLMSFRKIAITPFAPRNGFGGMINSTWPLL